MKEKILFIGPYPPPFSGPEISMKEFLDSNIIQNNFRITFLKTNFRKDNVNKAKFGSEMILNFFIYFWRLFVTLIKIRPKMAYYPVTPTQIGWVGRDAFTIILCKLLGTKVLIHMRGSHFKLNFQNFSSIAKWLTGFSLKMVNAVIVQAEYLKDMFQPYIKEEDHLVLYQSIDTGYYNNENINKVIEGKILFLGHLTKAKGYTDLLKVIPSVVEDIPKANFYFAGNIRKGERGVFYDQTNGKKITYEDPFEAEAIIKNSKYGNNYHYLGLISGDEKLKHFSEADIFILPSYSEGFSRALLEAMAMGKPLVYTPVGAHKEVLVNGENGIMVYPGKTEDLAAAIKKILADRDLRNKIAENNYFYSRNKFNVNSICENFSEIIKNTLIK